MVAELGAITMIPRPTPTWVVDSSSIILLRSTLTVPGRVLAETGMTVLVTEGRLVFPGQVVREFERYKGRTNPALEWAAANEAVASRAQASLDLVKAVLAQVPQILDAEKAGGG